MAAFLIMIFTSTLLLCVPFNFYVKSCFFPLLWLSYTILKSHENEIEVGKIGNHTSWSPSLNQMPCMVR